MLIYSHKTVKLKDENFLENNESADACRLMSWSLCKQVAPLAPSGHLEYDNYQFHGHQGYQGHNFEPVWPNMAITETVLDYLNKTNNQKNIRVKLF